MEASALSCIKCRTPLFSPENPGAARFPYNTGETAPCPACGKEEVLEIFPAVYRTTTGNAGEKVISEEEAACFYHPQKKAAVPCDGCGRFLCALCDVELDGQHLCPNCLQSGKKKGKLKNLENERVLYDQIALTTATLPLLFMFVVPITAPAAIYLSIKHWKSPSSIVPRHSKLRFSFAIFFALLELAGCALIIMMMFRGRR